MTNRSAICSIDGIAAHATTVKASSDGSVASGMTIPAARPPNATVGDCPYCRHRLGHVARAHLHHYFPHEW
ncbi:MAG: hypothetical protein J2P57_02110 [Acidimicrobiaceae bacterium]|nr:hypothetical protein [Acidimicrobiaceae bacterium]